MAKTLTHVAVRKVKTECNSSTHKMRRKKSCLLNNESQMSSDCHMMCYDLVTDMLHAFICKTEESFSCSFVLQTNNVELSELWSTELGGIR